MRGGQQTKGGAAVRRNSVIRGRLSLLLVISVFIRGVLRLIFVHRTTRWSFGRALYWLNSSSLSFRTLSLFVVFFISSRSTGSVRSRCVLKSARVNPVHILFPSSKSLRRVVSIRVRVLRRDPLLGSIARASCLRDNRTVRWSVTVASSSSDATVT